ncbi:MAG: sigma 54-interacting transcriptional regulator [candidate division WOR-3 bacterium]|nr:MAG: sigma 54-interacting transcriptional regulator [candidate division WOR-3 bacterium]
MVKQTVGFPSLLSIAASDLAELEILRGDLDTAAELIETAFRNARAAGSPRREALAWNARGMLALSRADFAEARSCFQQCLNAAREVDDLLTLRVGLINLANVAAEQGRSMEAVDMYRECLRLDEQSANPLARAISIYNLGWALMRTGRWEEAAENLYRTVEISEQYGYLKLQLKAASCLGSLYLKRNQLDKAELQFQSIVDAETPEPRFVLTLVNALANLGRTRLRSGNLAAGRRAFDRALAQCDRSVTPNQRAGVLLGLAELAVAERRFDEARRHIDVAAELLGSPIPPLDEGELSRVRALMSVETGDTKAAAEDFARAAGLFARVGDGYELAELRLRWGKWLAESGDWLGATPLLEAASAAMRRLSVVAEAEEAGRLLFELRRQADAESALLEALSNLPGLGLEPVACLESVLDMAVRAVGCDSGAVLLRDRPVALRGTPDLKKVRAADAARPSGDPTSLAIAVKGVGDVHGLVWLQSHEGRVARLSPRVLDRIAWAAAEPLTRLSELPNLFTYDRVQIKGLCYRGVIGSDPVMLDNLKVVSQAAGTALPILIRGESGTGKELIARAVHDSGPRRDRQFMAINCSAIPEGLLEAEFFGVEKGAATGVSRRVGKFEAADRGTVFLDEIGDMSPRLQARLLRVLQDGSFHRVGGNKPVAVDVRVVAATNQDLERLIGGDRFRSDLYYRLNACELTLPPLRERAQDIPVFVNYFIARSNQEFGRRVQGVARDCIRCFEAYDWPGNIRELRHVIEQSVLLARGPEVTVDDLPRHIRRLCVLVQTLKPGEDRKARREARLRLEAQSQRQLILDSLQKTDWQVSKAARLAGYSRSQFYRLMGRHGIRGAREHRNVNE